MKLVVVTLVALFVIPNARAFATRTHILHEPKSNDPFGVEGVYFKKYPNNTFENPYYFAEREAEEEAQALCDSIDLESTRISDWTYEVVSRIPFGIRAKAVFICR